MVLGQRMAPLEMKRQLRLGQKVGDVLTTRVDTLSSSRCHRSTDAHCPSVDSAPTIRGRAPFDSIEMRLASAILATIGRCQ